MRLSQPAGESDLFASLLGTILQDVNPAYRRNATAKGIRCEFLRELSPGVFASHNSICRNGRYYHCFALTLDRNLPKTYLKNPFTIGSRFDKHHSINLAFQRDLGWSPADQERPLRLSDSHEMRKGCERIIARCTAEAEIHLLPHYLEGYRAAKTALLALVEACREQVPTIAEVPQEDGPESITPHEFDMFEFAGAFAASGSSSERFFREVIGAQRRYFSDVLPRLGRIEEALRSID